MKRSAMNHDIVNKDDEYGTPKEMYNAICKKFNIFPKLDACASEKNHVVNNYITEEDNALRLTDSFKVDFFVNPPYSKVEQFMEHSWKQHRKWNTNALILVYAKTDTRWCHRWVESKYYDKLYNPDEKYLLSDGTNEVTRHFIQGRLRFIKNGQRTRNSAPYPSAWIVYHKDQAKG